ncbi:hypothetical protein [Thiohalocapsa halophila]|uniref:hypothetical protein n=1 Tax=Thiohalocapsa halophila TaxID=69359 RepID=UPI0019079B5D|nr:hypothetical protein [Thiohalocapsa halophila]
MPIEKSDPEVLSFAGFLNSYRVGNVPVAGEAKLYPLYNDAKQLQKSLEAAKVSQGTRDALDRATARLTAQELAPGERALEVSEALKVLLKEITREQLANDSVGKGFERAVVSLLQSAKALNDQRLLRSAISVGESFDRELKR